MLQRRVDLLVVPDQSPSLQAKDVGSQADFLARIPLIWQVGT